MRRRRPTTRPPYERLVWFHAQVRQGRYPNAVTLGAQFEVSERTAYRDIAFLRSRLEAPLDFDKQRNGFYYTDPAFSLPAVMLTEGELVALFLAEQVLCQYSGTPYEAELRSAFAKLCEALPEEVTIDLGAFAEVVSFQTGPARPIEVQTYQQALCAIQNRQSLRLRYYAASHDKEAVRRVDPYHLHNQAGDWYLIAYDHERTDFRDFALSRIRDLQPAGQTFTPRKDFARSAYLADHFGGFRGEQPMEVVVRFDAYQARWMREKTWPGETAREEHLDGSLTLHLTVTNLDGILRWVLQYGSHATVLAPEEFRKAIVAEVKALANNYEGDQK